VLDFLSKVSDRYLCFSRFGSPSLHLATMIKSNDSKLNVNVKWLIPMYNEKHDETEKMKYAIAR
jgi:hypothetical protein